MGVLAWAQKKLEPMLKLQKMYGEIFTLSGLYLNKYLLNVCQIFTIISFFKSSFWTWQQNVKNRKKGFVTSSLEDSIASQKYQKTSSQCL